MESITAGFDAPPAGRAPVDPPRPWLRRFTKLLVASTLILIFIGGLVTSHGAGLSVPDWPTTYGENMFTYPISKWTGGIFYEHGHRLFASYVGFLMLILAPWLFFADKRTWVRVLGVAGLILVVAQGVLGGVSVLMRLSWQSPMPVWFGTLVFHAVLAQSFLVLNVILAYAVSRERRSRLETEEALVDPGLRRMAFFLFGLIFAQLIIAASVRHLGAGIALLDFPTSAGYIIPPFNEEMVERANAMRMAYAAESGIEFAPITLPQIVIHFVHRLVAFIIVGAVAVLAVRAKRRHPESRLVMRSVWLLVGLVAVQFTLGILTVLSVKEPTLTSLHVVTGAATLAASALLILRILPVGTPAAEPAPSAAPLKAATAS